MLSIKYLNTVRNILDKIENNNDAMGKAVDILCDTFKKDGMLFVFGTGHSHMFSLELFYRAGGLVRVCPVLDEGLLLHYSAVKSTYFERLEGYAEIVFNSYDMKSGDTVIICSNSGINPVPIEMAQLAKKHGLKVIGLTCMNQSKVSKSRHSSGKKLYELCDVVLDNFGETGDACLEVPDSKQKFAPTSSVSGMVILNMLVAGTVEALSKEGKTPEVFMSSNMPDGQDMNEIYIKKYKGIIKSLY